MSNDEVKSKGAVGWLLLLSLVRWYEFGGVLTVLALLK